MLSRNAKLVGFVALLAGFIMGCGKTDDINPLASRHLVVTMNMGSALTTVARSVNPSFDSRNHCVQWIEYRLDGEAHGQRLEISNQACPSSNEPFAVQTRVARLRISVATGNSIYNIYDKNADRKFGQFRLVTSSGPSVPNDIQLTALCGFAQVSERSFYENNCSVSMSTAGRIQSVNAR